MKNMIKNITLALIVSTTLFAQSVNAARGRGSTRVAAPKKDQLAEFNKLENAEANYRKQTKKDEKDKAAQSEQLRDMHFGFDAIDQAGQSIRNESLSSTEQTIVFENLSKINEKIRAQTARFKTKLLAGLSTEEQKAQEEKIINQTLQLIESIAGNKDDWKTLKETIGLLDKKEKIDSGFHTRMNQKIYQNDTFSVNAGLSALDANPSQTFVTQLRAHTDNLKTIEKALITKLDTKDLDKIVEYLFTITTQEIYSSIQISDENLKDTTAITTGKALRTYLQNQQKAHKIISENSLAMKNQLFNQYKEIGFKDEIAGSKIHDMFFSIGAPGFAAIALLLVMGLGASDKLPNIPNPLDNASPMKTQDLFNQAKDYIQKFFAPATP